MEYSMHNTRCTETQNVLLECVAGCGCGCAVLASVTSVVQWFDRKRGIAVGIVAAGTGIGSAFYAPLITFMIDKYGWGGECFSI